MTMESHGGAFYRDPTILEPEYVIWSNEHRAWWAPVERGYVQSLADAGKYSRQRAMQVAASQWLMPFDGIPNEIALRFDDALEQTVGTRFA